MQIEKNRNNILSHTLYEILNKRLTRSLGGKSLICVEGFSKPVFEKLKKMIPGDQADIFWAAEIMGYDLVRIRNDAALSKALVVFIDRYFSESQSLGHFFRITDEHFLVKDEYLKILLSKTFHFESDIDIRVFEAVTKIINVIQPSLVDITDYLAESLNDEDIYTGMGKALWRLGVFSYEKLITENLYKISVVNQTVESILQKININIPYQQVLKKGFTTYLKHNQQYSSLASLGRFSYTRINKAEITDHERKALFDYVTGGDRQECYRKVDFLTIKKVLKKPIAESHKTKNSINDEKEKNILQSIAKRIKEDGEYECVFGEESPFNIEFKPIPFENIFKPVSGFDKWDEQWRNCLKNQNERQFNDKDDEDKDDEDKNSVEITVTNNNSQTSIVFSIDISEKSRRVKTSNLSKSAKPSKNNTLIKSVKKFETQRNKIMKYISNPSFLTLHLDTEAFVCSYLSIIKILWDNANQWAQYDWFKALLNDFVKLDTTIETDYETGEFEILPSHPFMLLKKRVEEVLDIEIICGEAGLEKNIDISLSEYYEQRENLFMDIWPRYFAWPGTDNHPLNFDFNDEKIKYRSKQNMFTKKSTLVDALNPQIETYLQENPLAIHSLQLKALNPLDGSDIYQALYKLFRARGRKADTPENIFLSAIGPNHAQTLSYFDQQAQSKDTAHDGMFQLSHNRMHPFCRYEKQLKGKPGENWLQQYLENVSDNENKADIAFAMDPFDEMHKVEDIVMATEYSNEIDNCLKEFEAGNLKLADIVDGPDKEYFRLAFEAFSIMVKNRGAEKRIFHFSLDTSNYINLIKGMAELGKWGLIVDRYLTDYYAENLTEELNRETNHKVSSLPRESSGGTTYLILFPPEKPAYHIRIKKILPIYLRDNEDFRGWLALAYKDFLSVDNFPNIYFSKDRQYLIPLNILPEWFRHSLLFGYEEIEEIEEVNSSPSNYLIKLEFKEDVANDMVYRSSLWKTEVTRETKVVKKVNLEFSLFESGNSSLHSKLKTKTVTDILRTLLVNPYQSWFLAVLALNSSNIKKDGADIFDISDDENISIGKIEIWRLRRLTTWLIKFNSYRHEKISHDEMLTIDSLFERIMVDCPEFVQDFMDKLCNKRPGFFDNNPYLKKFLSPE
ncbi:MAG: hypothetical protein GY795_49805 [Desulfobacterales bacterium]|nr:hypothetical protein [Desulfobacterales bacterium]